MEYHESEVHKLMLEGVRIGITKFFNDPNFFFPVEAKLRGIIDSEVEKHKSEILRHGNENTHNFIKIGKIKGRIDREMAKKF